MGSSEILLGITQQWNGVPSRGEQLLMGCLENAYLEKEKEKSN